MGVNSSNSNGKREKKNSLESRRLFPENEKECGKEITRTADL